MRASLHFTITSALLACGCHAGFAGGEVDAPTDSPVDAPAMSSRELCKLLSDRNTSDPTANDVQHRANLLGADLGIPVEYHGHVYVFFGDSIGFAGIWSPSESHPDAVGYSGDPSTAVAGQPTLLCTGLDILTIPAAQSRGPQVDPSVMADFAGAAMTAPAGHTLGEYIHNPAGDSNGTLFPFLPGNYEVPSGAFAYGDSIYVFYTTVSSHAQPDMQASYLARWTNPSTTGAPNYQILYGVDERFDANGALHGHFINVAAEVQGDYVYLFGTGEYRKSAIYVARKRLDALATPGGFEELGTIVATPGYGETSVRYLPDAARWVLLAEELTATSNRIVAYTAQTPIGPWSAPAIVHDMADPSFRAAYCCTSDDDCEGQQMFNCDHTGFYGTYMLPSAIGSGSTATITYTMSSFSPYNVALFQTTLPL